MKLKKIAIFLMILAGAGFVYGVYSYNEYKYYNQQAKNDLFNLQDLTRKMAPPSETETVMYRLKLNSEIASEWKTKWMFTLIPAVLLDLTGLILFMTCIQKQKKR